MLSWGDESRGSGERARRDTRRWHGEPGCGDDAGAGSPESGANPRPSARVGLLGRRTGGGGWDGAVGCLASASAVAPSRACDRCAAGTTDDLHTARLACRCPARGGGLSRRARAARLPDEAGSRSGVVSEHHHYGALLEEHERTHGVGDAEHDHGHDGHAHSHGLVDRSIVRSREGVKAVSISLAVLGAAALVQVAIFVLSGSVALLADLIHNFGDARTAVPLGIAFFLRSFRGEKVAGLAVVLAIFVSACVALYETI